MFRSSYDSIIKENMTTTTLRHCQTLQEHAGDNASGPAKVFQSA